MNGWQGLLCGVVVIGGVASLYGLHRLCLWLEQRGHLYYLHKKPDSSAASCFVALQQTLEPQSKHVLHIKEQKRHHSEDAAPGDRQEEKGCG